MARRGGFPVGIFCNQSKSEFFHCFVCTEVCRSPVTCRSGAHLFCLECLTESLRQNASCPVCREPLAAPAPSAFASAQVSALDVQCVNDKCKWKGTCGRLDSHLITDCLHEPIKCPAEGCGALVPRGEMATHEEFVCLQSCPNSKPKAKRDEQDTCNVRLSRKDLVEHLKDVCKLRLVHCPHPSCEVSTQYNRMPAHLETCPYAPVPCPRQCGTLNLIRQSLEAHKKDCPNEPVPCVHAPLGCSHVAPRCEIVQHEQNVEVHFSALRSKAFAEQQQAYQQQIGEMKEMFVKKLQTLEEKLGQQTRKIQTLENTNAQLLEQQAIKFQTLEDKLLQQTTKIQTLENTNAQLLGQQAIKLQTLQEKLEQQTPYLKKLEQQSTSLHTKLQELQQSRRPYGY